VHGSLRNGFGLDDLVLEGLALVGCGPIRHGWIPLDGGLTVLYGLNGAGKTTVLRALESVLTGINLVGDGAALLLVRVTQEYLDEATTPAVVLLNPFIDDRRPEISRMLRDRLRSDAFYDSEYSTEGALLEAASQRRFLVYADGDRSPSWAAKQAALLGEGTAALEELLASEARDENSTPSLLPVFPDDVDGLPPLVAAPFARGAELIMPATFGEKDTPAIVNEALRALLVGPANEILAILRGEKPVLAPDVHPLTADGPAPELVEVCAELGRLATTELRRLMPTDLTLDVRIRSPRQWLAGRPVEWAGVTAGGSEIPLDQLSRAELRWSIVAIATAHRTLSTSLRGRPSILPPPTALETTLVRIIDEPEAALHRSAEARMARALTETPTDEMTIVATHSPALLDASQAVFLVSSTSPGNAISAWDATDQANLERLGLGRSDLLGRYSVMLAVEGVHEKWILEELLGPELEAMRVVVQPLYGGSRAAQLVHADFITRFTDWSVVVMWDNLRAVELSQAWERTTEMAEAGAQREEIRAMLRERLRGSSESKFATQFMEQAAAAGRTDRFGAPFAMSRKDILHYLPTQALSPRMPAKWEEVWERYAAQPTQLDEKAWITTTFDARLDEPTIRAAARQIDSAALAGDFAALLRHLEHVHG